MSNLLTVSPSPHVHSDDSAKKIMYRVVLALTPALIWSVFVIWDGRIKGITILPVAAFNGI